VFTAGHLWFNHKFYKLIFNVIHNIDMSEGYADTILIDCNRRSSEQEKGNENNDGNALWTNKIGSGIKVNQGDRVSVHSGFVSERGCGADTMEFEGITRKEQYYLDCPILTKTQYYNNAKDNQGTPDRIDPNSNGQVAEAMCHQYQTETQGPFDLKDNEIHYKISYYKTTNGEGYFHLPRRFDAWKQNFNRNSVRYTGANPAAVEPVCEFNNYYYTNNNTHLWFLQSATNTPLNHNSAGGNVAAKKLLPDSFVLTPFVDSARTIPPAGPVVNTNLGWSMSPEFLMNGGNMANLPVPSQDCWVNGKSMNIYEDYNLSSLRPTRADLRWNTGYWGQSEPPTSTSVTDDAATAVPAVPDASYISTGWKAKNDNSKYTLFVKELTYFSNPLYDKTTPEICSDSPSVSYIKDTAKGDDATTNNETSSRYDFYPYTDMASVVQYSGGGMDGGSRGRSPSISEYKKYEEVKTFSVNAGYNAPQNVADVLTEQLNRSTAEKTIYGSVGGFQNDPTYYTKAEPYDTAGNEVVSSLTSWSDGKEELPITIKKESETYKTFPAATSVTFNSEHHSRFFSETNMNMPKLTNSATDNPTFHQFPIDYLSSYATIGVKRPDLWEAGRKITKTMGRRVIGEGTMTGDYYPDTQVGTGDWAWRDVIYPAIQAAIPVADQLTAVITTDWEWNETNLKTLKEFFDIQGKYPELFEGVPYEVNTVAGDSVATEGLNPTNSRYIHMHHSDSVGSTWNPIGDENWKGDLGGDHYGGSYIESTYADTLSNFLIGYPTGAGKLKVHSSMPLWFYYDSARADIASGGDNDDTLYYGFAKKHIYDRQYTLLTGQVGIAFTTRKIGGLNDGYFKNGLGATVTSIGLSRSRTIGFDCHFSAYGSSAICLYSGLLSGVQNVTQEVTSQGWTISTDSYANLLDRDKAVNKFQQNPVVLGSAGYKGSNTYLNIYNPKFPVYQYIRERYVGANNPQLSFDDKSSRFNFQSLHSPEMVGNSGWAGSDQVDSKAADAPAEETPILPSTNNKVYFVNKRFENRVDYCPDMYPYNTEALTEITTGPATAQTYIPFNPQAEAWKVFDADGGIFIEDWGLGDNGLRGSDEQTSTEKDTRRQLLWDKSLWGSLGFSYEQFHSNTTLSRQNRVSNITTNTDNAALTTNALVSQADLGQYGGSIYGGIYNVEQLPVPPSSRWVESVQGTTSADWLYQTHNSYPIVNIEQVSTECLAQNLPRKMINPYYLIKSDIVSDVKYLGGDDSGQGLPIVSVVNKENGFGDYFFQAASQQEFTITQSRTITDITTSIHLPSMRTPILNDGSSIIYKIVKANTAQLDVASQILSKKQKK
jgi:hypothetical protein